MHPILDAILWTLLGILFVEAIFVPWKSTTKVGEVLKKIIPNIIKGLVFTMVFVKIEEVAVDLIQEFTSFDFTRTIEILNDANLDQSQMYLIVSILFQLYLNKILNKTN